MINLKYCIVLISLSTVIAAQVTVEEVQTFFQYHQECKSETEIEDSLVLGTLSGNVPDDPTLKKHLYCMSKKFGFQNEFGEIQRDAIESKVKGVINDPHKVDEIMEKCAVAQENPEKTATEMVKCYYESISSNLF